MEHYKISTLLNDSVVIKFVTMKWAEVNDLSSGQYSVNNNIRFKTWMLRSAVCDYSDTYIGLKGRISVIGTYDANRRKISWHLRIMLHLDHAYQKSITHL